MASQQDLKRRIRSVRNTRKITKAMELVAGARLRRAEARIQAMRPYAERMRELMIGTARAAGQASSRLPLLEERDEVALDRHRRAHRRPGPGRPLQLADPPARVLRSSASSGLGQARRAGSSPARRAARR